MDSYQAIYDAVRSKIGACNTHEAVLEAFRQMNLGHYFNIAMQEITYSATRPCVLYRPAVFPDGKAWCALYGKDLQEGVAGFGASPAEAMADFDKNWNEKIASASTRGHQP